MNMEITVILEKSDEGGYTIFVPSMSGCISQGETKDEAIKNIKEAIELYLEDDSTETYSGEKIKLRI